MSWHPYLGEVIGFYLEGVIFKWHPYHDETQEVHAGANSFPVSQDAKCLATGDPNGIIKLFGMADFNFVYQFVSQDAVFDLCFAPDSRRLYDVRGSHSNVWEPNALIRLSELTEPSDDSVSVKSHGSQSTILKTMPGKIDPIASLAPQPTGRLNCCGTESGLIEIFEAGRGSITELRRSKSFMGIEHTIWSDDGRFVAFVDLCGTLFVKCIPPSLGTQPSLVIETKLEITIDNAEGAIGQLLFHPESDRLLIYSSLTATVCSLATKSIVALQNLEARGDIYKWINHPSDQNYLLSFGPCTVHIWSWEGLAEMSTLSFDCPIMSHGSSTSRSRMSSSTNTWESKESVDKVLVTVDKTCILVQCSCPSSQGQKKMTRFYLMLQPSLSLQSLISHLLAHRSSPSRHSP